MYSAGESVCFNCQKVGHFAKVCYRKRLVPSTGSAKKISASIQPHSTIATVSNKVPTSLEKAAATVTINGNQVKALFYSCSSENFVNSRFARAAKLNMFSCTESVSMASSD